MSLEAREDDQLSEPGASDTDAERAELKLEEDSDSDETDSDDEETKKQVPVKALLDEVLNKIRNGELDLNDAEQYEDFVARDGKRLASATGDQDQPTVLHIIASKDKKELPKFDSKMQPLIEFLAKEPSYLEKQNRSDHTSLFLAIEAKKKEMVQWICDARQDIRTILAITDSRKMNCLHAGINKRVKFLSLLIEKADPQTLAAKDTKGDTPLHLAVEYKKCRKGQLDIVKQIIEKSDELVLRGGSSADFNDAGLSPYLHHQESVRKAQAKEKKAGEGSDRHKPSSRHMNPATAEKPSKDVGLNRKEAVSSSGPTLGQVGDPGRSERRLITQLDHRTKYGGGGPITPLASAMQRVETSAPESINGDKKEEKSSSSSSRVDEATVRAIERLLKLHYLRSRDHNAAMEILHGRDTTTDQELYFDLSGNIKTGVITQGGIDNLLSKLKFEDTLQYVCIPKLSVQLNQPSERPSANRRVARTKPSDEVGKRDLCYIFDRLRHKKVNTVLKVIVDDMDSPSHSDEAIENALKNMDVEMWNWQKFDLCTEVIYKAAPKAREVHLYWTRNNAVLRGWSDEGGLKKLRELKLVHIHVHQGLESLARTQLNIKEFKDRMEKLCPQVKIETKWPDTRYTAGEANPTRIEDQQDHSTRHEWIQCMKDFRKLLFDAERYYRGQPAIADSIEEPIKVALIDDGVDVKDLEYTFIGGRTFCPRVEHQNLNNPYYVSGSGHGTIMAKQIHLMCPRAQFYVLRLEDCLPEDDTALSLTARSATLAIRAAIRKGVHIISMSWTIDPPENDTERNDLENAIIDAAKANILMFCSATDKGAKQTDTYPSKATPNRVFTIGAANSSGAILDYVGNLANISYTFPGDKVEVDGGPLRTDAQQITDGSSVATALAAGLAALILYCFQVRILLAPDQEKERARKQFQLLKKHDGMKSAFSAIGTTEESTYKFLKVWEVFGNIVKRKEEKDQELWIELISDVGTRLSAKIYN